MEVIDAAYEAHEEEGEVSLMITKHCLRFSFNLCPKQAKGVKGVMGQVRADPMTLKSGNETYTLKFECLAVRDARDGQDEKTRSQIAAAQRIALYRPADFFQAAPAIMLAAVSRETANPCA
ncbi:hypothetical protein [Paludibacterium denitrificans]|uniref:hypothetical protein n=1 Tax=Paludibacterium denitrificans TaxID=2675226 RepID=UPI0028A62274|nr:hypothetical protein [Paludibacterium denitrificans]